MREEAVLSPPLPSTYSPTPQPPQLEFQAAEHHDPTAMRLVAVLGGAVLVGLAAQRRSWRSAFTAPAGAALVYRGITGRWPLPESVERAVREAVPVRVETSVTVNRPAQELYDFWRKLENLPRFMRHLDSVERDGNGRSHWVGRSPVGLKAEWEAEIIEDRPGQLLSWRTLPGSRVQNAGSVLFEPATGGRGTVVRVAMEVQPPGRALGRAIGALIQPGAEQEVKEDLRRFKQLMEAGEVPTTEGQPTGRRPLLNPRNPL